MPDVAGKRKITVRKTSPESVLEVGHRQIKMTHAGRKTDLLVEMVIHPAAAASNLFVFRT